MRSSASRTASGVEVTSSGWQVRVGVETFESPCIWSDNYFDTLPRETRTLHVDHGNLPRRRALHGSARLGPRSRRASRRY